MKSLIVLVPFMLALLIVPACKKNPAQPAPQSDSAANTNPDTNSSEQKSPEQIEADEKKKQEMLALAQKNIEEGNSLPPRPELSFDVIKTNSNTSFDDVSTSFNYVKSSFTRCYTNTLFFDKNTKGSLTISIKRDGQNPLAITELKTDISIGDFESCIRKSATKWITPPNAEFTAKIDFSSKPPLTADEMRKINHSLGAGNPEENHHH